ncbi:MAG TPA: hypothetical protein VHU61_12815, partial [Solirubrobacteraceae bacterium]|nr:hypothetical protein [Solirubrobacteraceae bacterium]
MVTTTTTGGTELAPTGALTGEPRWLALEPEPIYAVLHTPEIGALSERAALLLPTFGWDDECAYRRRRDWATQLASRGITAARFDFPGRENSVGSPLAPGRARSWVEATVEAARWLRRSSGAQRLTVIGVGIGGLIAYQAAVADAAIDDLVLWGVRSSGRAHVRELRAYAAVTAGADERDSSRSDGAIGIGGHIMSSETAADLSSVDLTRLALPDADRRRVLLIGRDAHGIDVKLDEHLARSRAELTRLQTDEYHSLNSPADLGLQPVKTLAATVEWIAAAATTAAPADVELGAHGEPDAAGELGAVGTATETGTIAFERDGVLIRERLTALETPTGVLRGIICEPAAATASSCCLVTVNSGALRHTGPNRMFVELARSAAASGITAARFDLPGLGDSDGTAIRSFERTDADDRSSLAVIKAIYDHLERLGPAQTFVAAGFSLAGYLTVRVATTDPRVKAALCVNPTGFVWTDKQRKRVLKDLIAAAGADSLRAEPQPRRLPRPLWPLADAAKRLGRALDAHLRRRLAHSDFLWRIEHRRELAGLDLRLDELAVAGTKMLLLLSEDEQLLRMLERPAPAAKLAHSTAITVARLPNPDHLLRPLWIQEIVIKRFVAALEQ